MTLKLLESYYRHLICKLKNGEIESVIEDLKSGIRMIEKDTSHNGGDIIDPDNFIEEGNLFSRRGIK